MADRNQPVGANLRRLFQRNRTQDEQDILDAYNRQIPVDEIRRGRAASESAPAVRTPSADPMSPVGPFQSRSGIMAGEGTPEASDNERTGSQLNAIIASRRAEREAMAGRPRTRNSPPRGMARASAPAGPSANDLNAMSLTRGVGADNAPDTAAAANIRRRLAEMEPGMKKGGPVKKMAKGGAVKSTKGMKPVYKMAGGGAARGDGCAARGKTKGRMV
jgi:hypothetical protein